jgi:hypothetical protein
MLEYCLTNHVGNSVLIQKLVGLLTKKIILGIKKIMIFYFEV